MLKEDVQVTPNNPLFYDACIGVLMCSSFVLPLVLVARRLRWSVEEEEDDDEVASVNRAATARILRESATNGHMDPVHVAHLHPADGTRSPH